MVFLHKVAKVFETSPSTEKLDAALAKVQGEVKPALKDSLNPHFRSSYADLASVWDAIRLALSRNGVSVTQWPVDSDSSLVTMVTRVAHAGEWMKGTFSIPASKADAQGYGSAITYARRFTLMAAIGVAPEDDDGNAAAKSAPRDFQPSAKPKPLPVKRIDQAQAVPTVEAPPSPPASVSPQKEPTRGLSERQVEVQATLRARATAWTPEAAAAYLKTRFSVDRVDDLSEDAYGKFLFVLREQTEQSASAVLRATSAVAKRAEPDES